MSTAAQIRRIHTLKGKAKLRDHEYRTVLTSVAGAASSKDLDEAGADRVIAALGRLARADEAPRTPATTATGRFAPKLQSLWISGYNLGVIRDRSDRAMLAWLKNHLGVAHTRFLVNAASARPAIEGLKAWIEREGRIVWISEASPREQAENVCDAIAARLLALGDREVGFRPYLHGARHGLPNRAIDYATGDFHQLANLLGERLRARLAAREERA